VGTPARRPGLLSCIAEFTGEAGSLAEEEGFEPSVPCKQDNGWLLFRRWSRGLDRAAQRNDTIQVAHGIYKEEVLTGKSLSLISQYVKTPSSTRQADRMVSTSTVSTMPVLATS
jgi:hypothetical protein